LLVEVRRNREFKAFVAVACLQLVGIKLHRVASLSWLAEGRSRMLTDVRSL